MHFHGHDTKTATICICCFWFTGADLFLSCLSLHLSDLITVDHNMSAELTNTSADGQLMSVHIEENEHLMKQ